MDVSKDDLERISDKEVVEKNQQLQYYVVHKGTITPFPSITKYGFEDYDNEVTTFLMAGNKMYSISNFYVDDDTTAVRVRLFDNDRKTHTPVGTLWKKKILANKGGKRKTVRRIKKRSKKAAASKNYLRF